MKLNIDYSPLQKIVKKMGAKESDWKLPRSEYDYAERRWLDSDEKILREYLKMGRNIEEISKILRRSVKSIEKKIKKMSD